MAFRLLSIFVCPWKMISTDPVLIMVEANLRLRMNCQKSSKEIGNIGKSIQLNTQMFSEPLNFFGQLLETGSRKTFICHVSYIS